MNIVNMFLQKAMVDSSLVNAIIYAWKLPHLNILRVV